MQLFIVESPSKAKTITQYLKDGVGGADFKVLACRGHVRNIPSRGHAVVPEKNFAIEYEANPASASYVAEIVREAKKSTSIYLATDPDREGEAIAWHIVELLKEAGALRKEPEVNRIVFHEITPKAIREAVSNPRQLDYHLVNSQQARQALDYLIGFTLSPILWRRLPKSRSAGRVQSATLRLVCEREEEIRRFQQHEYWSIEAGLATSNQEIFSALLSSYGQEKIEKQLTETKAKDIVEHLRKSIFSVKEVKSKRLQRNPAPPYITSTLIQDASKIGLNAARAMRVAQNLYEGVETSRGVKGLITYMRTDSYNISADAAKSAAGIIKSTFGLEYLPEKPRKFANKSKSAQEAHEAIRPTDPSIFPNDAASYLSPEESKLYALIWCRFMASQMSSAVTLGTTIDIAASEGQKEIAIFKASGSVLLFPGFYAVRKYEPPFRKEQEEPMLPTLTANQSLEVHKLEPHQHFTQPPPRFNEASLVKSMEELGIGRPSTYAPIITLLRERGYVKLADGRFVPEEEGEVSNAFLTNFFDRYVHHDFTSALENELDAVAQGSEDYKELLQKFWVPFKSLSEEVMAIEPARVMLLLEKKLQYLILASLKDIKLNEAATEHSTAKDEIKEDGRHDSEEDGVALQCPQCNNGSIHLKGGKFGLFLGCSNYPECRFTRPLVAKGSKDEASDSSKQYPVTLEDDGASKIIMNKGPYGLYLALHQGDKVVKTVSIPPEWDVGEDMAAVRYLLSLPLNLGSHPETGTDILLHQGKFGFYLAYQGKFYSLKANEVRDMNIETAVQVIIRDATKKKRSQGQRSSIKKKTSVAKRATASSKVSRSSGATTKHGKGGAKRTGKQSTKGNAE